MQQQKIKEFDYFRRVVKSAVNGEAVPEKPNDVLWKSVFGLAMNHSLIFLTYDVLRDAVKRDGEAEIIEYLEKKYSIEYARHVSQVKEFKSITETFTENKIPFLPLKGFLMKELYPKPEYRQMADMDIYVGKENSKPAIDLLVGMGYDCKTDPDHTIINDVLIKLPFLNVELHKKTEADSKFGFKDCVKKEENPYWFEMKRADAVMFMLRHSRKHYLHGGCGIRAILDLYLFRKRYPDFFNSKDLYKEFESEELYEFYKIASEVGERWFSNSEYITELSPFEIYTITGGTYGSFTNLISQRLKNQSKFSYIMGRLFPPVKVIKKRYKWVEKCIILLPFGYVARFVQSIFNGRAKEHAVAISNSKKDTGL